MWIKQKEYEYLKTLSENKNYYDDYKNTLEKLNKVIDMLGYEEKKVKINKYGYVAYPYGSTIGFPPLGNGNGYIFQGEVNSVYQEYSEYESKQEFLERLIKLYDETKRLIKLYEEMEEGKKLKEDKNVHTKKK